MRVGRRGGLNAALILVGALATGWLAVAGSIAGATRAGAPEMALRVWPVDAGALSAAAERTLAAGTDPAHAAAAEALARRAIARDASFPAPFRVLGLAADLRGDRPLALRYMTHAAQLSRRDLQTELWFVDHRVDAGDVAGALEHFDAALRISESAPSLLFPILNQAIDEPPIVAPLAARLASRPPWRDAYLANAIDTGPSLRGLAALSEALARRGSPLSPERRHQLLERLVAGKAFPLAARVAATAGEDPASLRPLDAPESAVPFGWAIAAVPGGTIVPGNGKLRFRYEAGTGAELVHHLLALRPGRHALRFTGGSDAPTASAPYWAVVCGDTGHALAQASILGQPAGAPGRLDFAVPAAGCSGQWLILSVRSATGSGATEGWVGPVDLVAG